MANRVTMTICGTEYTLVAEEDAAYMEKVGAMVDGEMRQLMDGAHMSREQTADNIYEYLVDAVYRLKKSEIDELLEKRYAKFRKIGMFTE